MLCRMYGYPDTQKFSNRWVPLIDAASHGYIVEWGIIFSNNIATQILNYRRKHSFSQNVVLHFYMSAYIMDAICFTSNFNSTGWRWTIKDHTPIHIYHDILWESKFHPHFYKIFHGVMLPIHQSVFDKKDPRVSPEDNNDLLSIGNWFGE